MLGSRIRSPLHVLEEVLGEPDSDPGMDKSSTLFVHAFEGEELAVFDFHKPEWGGPPECLTDPRYVWSVDGDGHDVSRFCAWLSAEVMRRVPREVVELYRWPLPGDPLPTPPAPPTLPPRAHPPKVRTRGNPAAPPPPPLDAHRRRTAALQGALEKNDPIALAELRSDLRRLSADGQALAALIAAEPELSEPEVRERLGGAFERACGELDALLRALN
jgi:hypothetical protein